MYAWKRGLYAFFGKSNTEIDPAINFDFVMKNIYTYKYNGKIKEGLSSKKYNTSLRFVFMVFFKRETEVGVSWGINYYITYNNICTTQLLIDILNAPSKKEFYDLLVWPSNLP